MKENMKVKNIFKYISIYIYRERERESDHFICRKTETEISALEMCQ